MDNIEYTEEQEKEIVEHCIRSFLNDMKRVNCTMSSEELASMLKDLNKATDKIIQKRVTAKAIEEIQLRNLANM